jgi:hypothetical protein
MNHSTSGTNIDRRSLPCKRKCTSLFLKNYVLEYAIFYRTTYSLPVFRLRNALKGINKAQKSPDPGTTPGFDHQTGDIDKCQKQV